MRNNTKPVVFLSGPMSGKPDLGRRDFNMAEMKLRERGYRVLNPACLPIDLNTASYMPICLAMLMQADIIALLPGWEQSPGACVEHEVAVYRGMGVMVYEE